MEPRGQLWFALEALCRDFRDCSGLDDRAALEVLVTVLGNMRDEQEVELRRLDAGEPPGGSPDSPPT